MESGLRSSAPCHREVYKPGGTGATKVSRSCSLLRGNTSPRENNPERELIKKQLRKFRRRNSLFKGLAPSLTLRCEHGVPAPPRLPFSRGDALKGRGKAQGAFLRSSFDCIRYQHGKGCRFPRRRSFKTSVGGEEPPRTTPGSFPCRCVGQDSETSKEKSLWAPSIKKAPASVLMIHRPDVTRPFSAILETVSVWILRGALSEKRHTASGRFRPAYSSREKAPKPDSYVLPPFSQPELHCPSP